MLVKIWVNGVMHIIPDVISIELIEETSATEGYITILYITYLKYFDTDNPEGIELSKRFFYDDVKHMTVKRGNKNENK